MRRIELNQNLKDKALTALGVLTAAVIVYLSLSAGPTAPAHNQVALGAPGQGSATTPN